MKENSENILPPNILLKLSWASNVKLLSTKDRSDVLLNMYNYHTGDDLVPMSKAAQMFFSNAVDVFEYNIEEYKRKVEANRINGIKGGRPPKKELNNFLYYKKTQRTQVDLRKTQKTLKRKVQL